MTKGVNWLTLYNFKRVIKVLLILRKESTKVTIWGRNYIFTHLQLHLTKLSENREIREKDLPSAAVLLTFLSIPFHTTCNWSLFSTLTDLLWFNIMIFVDGVPFSTNSSSTSHSQVGNYVFSFSKYLTNQGFIHIHIHIHVWLSKSFKFQLVDLIA